MKPGLILRHEPDVSMGSLARVLADAGLETRQVDLFQAVPKGLPWTDLTGLIVLGGSMSANDGCKFPFLVAELDWLREAVRRNVPTLGICLGAQLLAKALGGEVYRSPASEIGWFQIEFLPAAAEDRLFAKRGPAETVFHWHRDMFELPAGAVHLAQSPACRQQAFRMGESAYGLQFHAEMVPELMELWLRESDASDVDANAIRSTARVGFSAMNPFTQCVLRRFAELCRANALGAQ
jgi:GMP synthase (glutamine-hydrolysing)